MTLDTVIEYALEDGAPVVADSNVKRLLAAAALGAQDLENALHQLLSQRDINTAVGEQLDVLGRQVDQARDGRDDDSYRRLVRARISAHRSRGTIEDLIKIIDLVIFDPAATIVVSNDGTATVRVLISGVATTDDVAEIAFDFAQDSAAAGTRVLLQSGSPAFADWFRLDDADHGLDGGTSGTEAYLTDAL